MRPSKRTVEIGLADSSRCSAFLHPTLNNLGTLQVQLGQPHRGGRWLHGLPGSDITMQGCWLAAVGRKPPFAALADETTRYKTLPPKAEVGKSSDLGRGEQIYP